MMILIVFLLIGCASTEDYCKRNVEKCEKFAATREARNWNSIKGVD